MLPMLKKHTLITTALVATLGLTACGSKKDVINPADNKTTTTPPTDSSQPKNPPTQGSTPNTTPPPTSGGNSSQGSQNGQNGGSIGNNLPNPNAPNSPNSAGSGAPQGVPVGPILPPSSQPPQAPPVGQVTPSPLPSEYRPEDPTNVERTGLAKRFTGFVTADGLLYTSSSTDSLLDFLRARNERVDQATRQANLTAAASVYLAKLNLDGGDAIVTLKILEGNELKTYNVAGAVNEDGPASTLRSVKSGNGQVTTGTRPLDGTLKCVDLDGGCENVFVRLRIGTPGSSAIINVVFRNSVADLYFDMPGQHSDNSEYLVLREFMINSITQKRSDNKIKQARMNSFEVVNGRSGVVLTMKAVNGELLGFAAPLLAPEAGTRVNIGLLRVAKEQKESLDLVNLDQEKLNYANTIGDGMLVANNSLGQVKIALKMRKRADFAQDQFTVTFLRKIKPLVNLTDDNLK